MTMYWLRRLKMPVDCGRSVGDTVVVVVVGMARCFLASDVQAPRTRSAHSAANQSVG